ncbi:MAG: MotA/TolQ/ExbB proton channel family protein [Lachnospiraceae bacterium]|nr:MotA/TolQ/ExbB proton channel family protein [Lachnospiraceae bacterium]
MDTTVFSTALRNVAGALETPVIVILLILIAATLVLLGSLAAEFFTERRRLKVRLPLLVDQLRSTTNIAGTVNESGLLKRQKKALTEVTLHPELTDVMREALALRLLEEEKSRFDNIVKLSEIIARLGPMLGLLGTLIPLGPGIVALGQGDTYTLSTSLLTAFDTTVAGLVCAAVATMISTIRKAWYNNYMSILESLMECVLEVMKNDA